MPRFPSACAIAITSALLAGLLQTAARAEASPPSLVLVIVVDQLRRDRMDPALPGGIGRLAREGRVYSDAALEHAPTYTGPGHAVLLTGQHPGTAGIPGNRFIDRQTNKLTYCVEDDAEAAAVLGAPLPLGRSPRNLRVSSLGGWMKDRWPGSRTFAVSAKDRSAILLGGHRAEAAYWFQMSGSVGFTTSRYYRSELPDWVSEWNGRNAPLDGFLASLPSRWLHSLELPSGRIDDYRGESQDTRRVSGHPLHAKKLSVYASNVYRSPYLDEVTLDFAQHLIERERLGRGPAPDLLALSLSATDSVGHAYGPGSHEAEDALRRLDAALGTLISQLERELGEGSILIALSSDHGVLPLPEVLAAAGESQCPLPGGRAKPKKMERRLYRSLHRRIGNRLSWPRRWVDRGDGQYTVRRQQARESGVDIARIIRVAEKRIEAEAVVAQAWTEAELRASDDPIAALYRNGYDPERSGDLIVQLEPTCLAMIFRTGTNHGSPYHYDRDVPLVFWGPGIEAGQVRGRAASVDIAPTLARRLGIETPANLAGRVLFD